ncbi:MAG: hypothetical protein ACLR5G_00910 [Eubacteriales bacterium]
MKTLLEISYVGTNFKGFQVQPNGRTVQETLQDALERLYGTRPAVRVAAVPTRAFMRSSFSRPLSRTAEYRAEGCPRR